MQIEIRKANIEDLKEVQNLNHMLFEKEFIEYDDSLNVGWSFAEILKEI